MDIVVNGDIGRTNAQYAQEGYLSRKAENQKEEEVESR